MMGMEAGQSAFGDAYAWFRDLLSWPLRQLGPDFISPAQLTTIIDKIIPELSRQAAALTPDPQAELALDWFNGRRTPDANQLLKGAVTGLGLGSDAPRLFRAIVESTCFGAKTIVDRFNREDVPVRGLIGLGGVAKKSPFIMQMMADVMNMPIRIHSSEQTCALGASMFAATTAGLYPKVEDAMAAIGQGFDATYTPDPTRIEVYAQRFRAYEKLGSFIEAETIANP
jgi:L-ribulokinase